MKNIGMILCIIFLIFFLCACSGVRPIESISKSSGAIIIDHTCTDITKVPEEWIKKAKTEFGVAYGHTSHGSQIISGLKSLEYKSDLYKISDHQSKKALTLYDREPRGDLGNPDRKRWARRTHDLLKQGFGDVNMVIWSWCGQVSSATKGDIRTYLYLMNELENNFPKVFFIYMTGHLDGTGETGNLNLRNNQIREYCIKNNKILFDFADIESFDPDGRYYLDKNASDGCGYSENGIQKNWAEEWCNRNPGKCVEYNCAHSTSLNCDLKANAFWWMMARIAGWMP